MDTKLINTFLDLIKIDSPSGEEDAIHDYIISRLKSTGIESEVDATGNLFARIEGTGDPVVLSCHLDTVEPGRGIEPIVDNGVIRSSGDTILGADNKVSVAVILHLLENLPTNHRSIEIVMSVCEETDGGINSFDFSKLKSKAGIVADSSTPVGTMITASPWIKDIFIDVTGKSAHSARPEEGINALKAVTKALYLLPWGRIEKDTTANIGEIEGGTGTNTIPGKIKLGGEIRSFSESLIIEKLGDIKDAFEKVCKEHGVALNFEVNDYCNGYVFSEDDKVIKNLSYIFSKLNIKPRFQVSHGGSDANAFNSHGIKVINIGDGSKNAHTVDESIEISELERLYSVFESYISI